MSRRRKPRDPRCTMRVVCSDRGRHDPWKLGTVEVYDEGGEIPDTAVTFGHTASAPRWADRDGGPTMKRHVHRPARGGRLQETVTYVCPVCQRNVPMTRPTWVPRVLALHRIGAAELDVSLVWA